VRARSIGIVYQAHHLLPEFTALENVMLAGLIAGARPAAAEKQARARLAEVGLADRLRHRPSKLSGGERQRTALARALINEPALVLADEPTGSLDAASSRSAIDLLWKSTLANQRALVIVTHEPAIASRANRILRLEDGRLFDRTGELKSA